MDGSIVFARLHQCASHVTHASFSPSPHSTIYTASLSVQPFLHSSGQCHQACPGTSFFIKITPSHGVLDPHLIHGSLSPPKPTTQTASRLVQAFLHAQLMAECRRAYQGKFFPLEIAPSHRGIWIPI